MPSIAALRHAPWSLSKIQSAQRCPLQFRYRYVDRIPEPEVSPEARIGKAVHRALEGLLTRTPLDDALAAGRRELLHPEEARRYEERSAGVRRFGERIEAFRRRRRIHAATVENRLAVTADGKPTPFHASDAFFRGVWDAGFLFDDATLAVVDHKTGVRHLITEYLDQLEGYALLAAAHHPHVRCVWIGIHFVADAAMEWWPPLSVGEVRSKVAPHVAALVEEAAVQIADGFPARPGALCRWCAYRSICAEGRRAAPPDPEASSEPVDGDDEPAEGPSFTASGT